MARPLARDAEDFARLMLQTVERLGQDGGWVRTREAFDQTVAAHPDHLFVAQMRAKPARRIALSATTERVRATEFAHIERRKVGTRRNAPVVYRIARPHLGLELQLPYEAAASHPLLIKRRADVEALAEPVSMRRAALTDPPPQSPWRRRLLRRISVAGARAPAWTLRLWWARLRGFAGALAATVTGR